MKKPPIAHLAGATLIDASQPAKERPDDPNKPKRKFYPKHDWIEIERIPVMNQLSSGGIDMSQHEGAVGFEARVISCGPGLNTLSGAALGCCCQPGDYVLANDIRSVWYDGHTHWLCQDKSVIAVVEPPVAQTDKPGAGLVS